MNYKKQKEELETEFNKKKEQMVSFQQQIQLLQEELLRIQGKFQMITELEKEK